jgi:hypothetical protein
LPGGWFRGAELRVWSLFIFTHDVPQPPNEGWRRLRRQPDVFASLREKI